MPDPRRRRRLGWQVVVLLALPAMLTISAPASVLAAAPINERCGDESMPPAGAPRICPETGVGGIDVGGAVPILGVVIAGGVLALVAAFLILRRRASGPFAPADPGEWWTCPKCGSTNVIGSARCYKCGTWQP
jgi:hypothetical protein